MDAEERIEFRDEIVEHIETLYNLSDGIYDWKAEDDKEIAAIFSSMATLSGKITYRAVSLKRAIQLDALQKKNIERAEKNRKKAAIG